MNIPILILNDQLLRYHTLTVRSRTGLGVKNSCRYFLLRFRHLHSVNSMVTDMATSTDAGAESVQRGRALTQLAFAFLKAPDLSLSEIRLLAAGLSCWWEGERIPQTYYETFDIPGEDPASWLDVANDEYQSGAERGVAVSKEDRANHVLAFATYAYAMSEFEVALHACRNLRVEEQTIDLLHFHAFLVRRVYLMKSSNSNDINSNTTKDKREMRELAELGFYVSGMAIPKLKGVDKHTKKPIGLDVFHRHADPSEFIMESVLEIFTFFLKLHAQNTPPQLVVRNRTSKARSTASTPSPNCPLGYVRVSLDSELKYLVEKYRDPKDAYPKAVPWREPLELILREMTPRIEQKILQMFNGGRVTVKSSGSKSRGTSLRMGNDFDGEAFDAGSDVDNMWILRLKDAASFAEAQKTYPDAMARFVKDAFADVKMDGTEYCAKALADLVARAKDSPGEFIITDDKFAEQSSLMKELEGAAIEERNFCTTFVSHETYGLEADFVPILEDCEGKLWVYNRRQKQWAPTVPDEISKLWKGAVEVASFLPELVVAVKVLKKRSSAERSPYTKRYLTGITIEMLAICWLRSMQDETDYKAAVLGSKSGGCFIEAFIRFLKFIKSLVGTLIFVPHYESLEPPCPINFWIMEDPLASTEIEKELEKVVQKLEQATTEGVGDGRALRFFCEAFNLPADDAMAPGSLKTVLAGGKRMEVLPSGEWTPFEGDIEEIPYIFSPSSLDLEAHVNANNKPKGS